MTNHNTRIHHINIYVCAHYWLSMPFSKTLRILAPKHEWRASVEGLTVYFFLPFFFELPWLTIGVAASADMPGIPPCRPG